MNLYINITHLGQIQNIIGIPEKILICKTCKDFKSSI